MKFFTKYLCAAIFFSVLFLGCKKDEEPEPKSTISFDGSSYELANGLLIDYGSFPPNEGSGQELFLSSSGVKIREKGGKIDSIYGVGHAILFDLFTTGKGELAEGEYTFDFSVGPFKPGAFIYSYAVFNGNFVTRLQNANVMIAGSMTVKKDKANYIITFDCIEGSGKHITGYFKGPLTVYDET